MMDLLLDTNIIIWFANGEDSLKAEVKEFICDNRNSKYCSIISLWEIAIKINIGKLNFSLPFKKLEELFLENNIKLIYPTIDELSFYKTLPLLHKDPFDRMIIAQGIVNNFKIITSDKIFEDYDVSVIPH